MHPADQARRYRHHHLDGGKYTIQKTNNPPWTFAATCGAAAGLCTTTQYADASPVIVDDGSDPTGMLCGR